jgi:hypothetical protein
MSSAPMSSQLYDGVTGGCVPWISVTKTRQENKTQMRGKKHKNFRRDTRLSGTEDLETDRRLEMVDRWKWRLTGCQKL